MLPPPAEENEGDAQSRYSDYRNARDSAANDGGLVCGLGCLRRRCRRRDSGGAARRRRLRARRRRQRIATRTAGVVRGAPRSTVGFSAKGEEGCIFRAGSRGVASPERRRYVRPGIAVAVCKAGGRAEQEASVSIYLIKSGHSPYQIVRIDLAGMITRRCLHGGQVITCREEIAVSLIQLAASYRAWNSPNGGHSRTLLAGCASYWRTCRCWLMQRLTYKALQTYLAHRCRSHRLHQVQSTRSTGLTRRSLAVAQAQNHA